MEACAVSSWEPSKEERGQSHHRRRCLYHLLALRSSLMVKSNTFILRRRSMLFLMDRLGPLKFGTRTFVRRINSLVLRSHIYESEPICHPVKHPKAFGPKRSPYSSAFSGSSAHPNLSLVSQCEVNSSNLRPSTRNTGEQIREQHIHRPLTVESAYVAEHY